MCDGSHPLRHPERRFWPNPVLTPRPPCIPNPPRAEQKRLAALPVPDNERVLPELSAALTAEPHERDRTAVSAVPPDPRDDPGCLAFADRVRGCISILLAAAESQRNPRPGPGPPDGPGAP